MGQWLSGGTHGATSALSQRGHRSAPASPDAVEGVGIEPQGTNSGAACCVRTSGVARVERWRWEVLGWLEPTAASSFAVAGVRASTEPTMQGMAGAADGRVRLVGV